MIVCNALDLFPRNPKGCICRILFVAALGTFVLPTLLGGARKSAISCIPQFIPIICSVPKEAGFGAKQVRQFGGIWSSCRTVRLHLGAVCRCNICPYIHFKGYLCVELRYSKTHLERKQNLGLALTDTIKRAK